ncbi:maleylpyruvate isomerase family mycothiol-dependent enzyme [Kribbella sp. NBC_01245]|uniref:maleylpyruvate isomerase family mycothiol-dependent enzyme n=1 Tax=Kribbella sp. NBC_01245 TaxID=2903578 RepID=UPI002E28C04F|nr:maleylpyruvate isomerase family mycothiol-dependent enzyme [Kribbella sp. NBC_01245]
MTDDAQILAWTKAERLSLADFLEELREDEWQADSLCAGWTVRDVAAHMTMSTRTTWSVVLKTVFRARLSFDRMETILATERARRFTPAELIAQLRETAGSPHRTPGAGILDPLLDALVHGQDIARPLGRVRRMPIEPAIHAANHVIGSKFYGAHRRLRDTRLVATDCDWSAGTGTQDLRGPLADLILVATGRPAGLPTLTGTATSRLTTTLKV